MRPLLLNTYDWGGAGIATRRILHALRDIGLDAKMLVQHSRSDDPHVVGPEGLFRRAYSAARIVTDPVPTIPYRGKHGNFSINWLPDDINRQLNRLDPDVIHLNWVGEGFFSVKSVGAMSAPIVWRLPDMWAMTGGCHYSGDCRRYESSCGSCPRLGSSREHDVTRWTWQRKAEAWRDTDIAIVAPSTWLAESARASSLFGESRIEIIPNALDATVFRPVDQEKARNRFDLPPDEELVLFGAQYATSDPRKGFDLLQKAIHRLADRGQNPDTQLVVFGGEEPDDPPDFEFPVRYLGYIEESSDLASLYAAADLMVVPSRYEGFGQTVSESLASGTPVVAFDATGPGDIVDHQETGYLAEPYDPEDLATGIEWVLEDEDRRQDLGEQGRSRAVDRYAQETVAEQYQNLYLDLLD